MNDLEHDLRELFRQKSASIDPSILLPAEVRRRSRLRQTSTVVGGVGAGVAIGVALALVVGTFRGPAERVPVGPTSYPPRTATIHGITVTAPAGWTLLDDWPLASILVTSSQTCSFSATGSPVVGSSTNNAGSAGPSSEPSQSCDSHPVSLPAGVPVLQLANFSIELDETVCRTETELPVAGVPDDGVAVYVAAFPNGVSAQKFLDACPDSEAMNTFADRGVTTAYAGVSIIGPNASDEDADRARATLESLGDLRVPSDEPSMPTPGYVVASGIDGGTTWRLEAGFPFTGSGSGLGATLITSDGDGHETASEPAPPAAATDVPVERSEPTADGSATLLWGTAAPAASSITNVAPDGTRTAATLLPWPDGLRPLTRDQETDQLDGWIWFAEVGEPGTLATESIDGAAPTSTAAGELDSTVEGNAIVATGHDLGVDWQLRMEGNTLTISIDGQPGDAYTFLRAGGTVELPAGEGAFLLGREPDDITSVNVSSDVSGRAPLALGRWMPADPDTSNGRIWLVPLAGAGSGFEQIHGRLPMAISWPPSAVPTPGDVVSVGTEDSASWAIRWSTESCPVLEVVASTGTGNTGTSDCLISWDGGDPAIGGVYGQTQAVVIVTGPDAMLCDVSPNDSGTGAISGGNVADVGPWVHTGLCIVTIPVGTTATIQLTDLRGNRILGLHGVVSIRAKPGSVAIVG